MATPRHRVNHPLHQRLRQLDREATRRFGRFALGNVGLMLNKRLDQFRYWCTPLNCVKFANTGGEGVHFSFLLDDDEVRASSPVVITIPVMVQSFVVGEDLFDFLCLGVHRGYSSLEQLAFHPKLTLKVFTNPDWQPTQSWHESVGFVPTEANKQLLAFLKSELDLKPWPNAARFAMLQKRYGSKLELPPDM